MTKTLIFEGDSKKNFDLLIAIAKEMGFSLKNDEVSSTQSYTVSDVEEKYIRKAQKEISDGKKLDEKNTEKQLKNLL